MNADRFTQLLAEYERAPAVTRERLYLETVELVLRNSKKVIVDTKGTGNMLYVPLEKMMERRKPALTLDEQRQVPATAPPRAVAAEEPVAATVESTRERGTR